MEEKVLLSIQQTQIIFIYFRFTYLMCVSVLPAGVCVHHMCAWRLRSQLGTHLVSAGTQTWACYKNRVLTAALSLQLQT